MTDAITLSLPDELSEKVRAIASNTNQSVEEVLLDYIRSLPLPLPALPPDEQAELDALHHLSDDTLWTIAQDELSVEVQTRAQELMTKNNHEALQADEEIELNQLVERADRLMVRKAESANILRQRGHTFTQQDFSPKNDG